LPLTRLTEVEEGKLRKTLADYGLLAPAKYELAGAPSACA
jgi:hypothetical protein